MTWTDSGMALFLWISAIAEGTVLIIVTGKADGFADTSKMFFTSQQAPPWHSGTKISKMERSKQTDVEPSTLLKLARSKTERHQWMKTQVFLCSMPIPLGFPVEPEV